MLERRLPREAGLTLDPCAPLVLSFSTQAKPLSYLWVGGRGGTVVCLPGYNPASRPLINVCGDERLCILFIYLQLMSEQVGEDH